MLNDVITTKWKEPTDRFTRYFAATVDLPKVKDVNAAAVAAASSYKHCV